MTVPRDDGWHIFDIVQQPDLENHLANVQRALHDELPEAAIFAGTLSSDELRAKEERGEFVPNGAIKGSWHARNPQLLSRIIKSGHIAPIHEWRAHEDEVFDLLNKMGQLLQGDTQ